HRGPSPPPCGVPRCRALTSPAALTVGACSPRSTESRIQRQAVCLRPAFLSRSGSSLSKAPLRSTSTTPSSCQHRCRVTATASLADLPGRYPYESGSKGGSRCGASALCATVWAPRAPTVAIPSGRPPPLAWGISPSLPGGGQSLPAASRFQMRERFPLSCGSKAARLSPAIPAAPRFAFTRRPASTTACCGMANGLGHASRSSLRRPWRSPSPPLISPLPPPPPPPPPPPLLSRSSLVPPSASPPGSRFGMPPRGVGLLPVPLSRESSVSPLPWQSLAHGPPASRPVAAGAVLRSPAGLSPRLAAPLVSTTSGSFDPSTALRLRSSPGHLPVVVGAPPFPPAFTTPPLKRRSRGVSTPSVNQP